MTSCGHGGAVEFRRSSAGHRFGLKGPRAAEWLTSQGISVPSVPNTWTNVALANLGSGASAGDFSTPVSGARASYGVAAGGGVLVARLGGTEFFLEDDADGTALRDIDPALTAYRVSGSRPGDGLSGDLQSGELPSGNLASGDCLSGHSLLGVYPVLRSDIAFVLSGGGSYDVLAQVCNVNFADLTLEANPVIMTVMIGVSVLVVPRIVGGQPHFFIWCDPTFGAYLEESLHKVVNESGERER
jgi:hypothetical protein